MEPVNANGSREQATKISQRRVCDLVGVDAKTVRRERLADHADIRKKMHEIAEKRRRFGYRRIGVMLERDGFTMNEKKLYRLYREEGLSLRRRRGRKRARGTRTPMPIPNRSNVRWSLDPRHDHSDQWRSHGSMSDTFGASRKFRVLAVNDDCTRENLALIADTSLSGARVARELTALFRLYGNTTALSAIDEDQQTIRGVVCLRRGTEFTSTAILKWASDTGVAWHYIDAGQSSGKQSPRLSSVPPHTQQNPRPLSRTSGVCGLDDRKLQRQPAGRMSERRDLRHPR